MPGAQFAVPPDERCFEDYPERGVFEYGDILVRADEIVEFARRFDPQDMHVDPEKAAAGRFGGLIASGWHTAAMMMRVMADEFLPRRASLGSPGIDELRWLKPVRPGDRLRVRVTILEKRRSRSKPDRGLLRTFVEVIDEAGDVVMSLKPMNILRCRDPQATP